MKGFGAFLGIASSIAVLGYGVLILLNFLVSFQIY